MSGRRSTCGAGLRCEVRNVVLVKVLRRLKDFLDSLAARGDMAGEDVEPGDGAT